ncbi:hypothetical protein PPACK8108_LOCUS2628 [Phakopsora pachyrhizi]|uniref:DUF1014-domain-containing protein n=1 Tax=Phakopsora pachyrhizi TaxID=170000 RepID=A0AAV0AIA9_PHAPC|nr:hypothetical protein PPACK8108_LOCUS2628 [Phakopsora pachyrhizi]
MPKGGGGKGAGAKAAKAAHQEEAKASKKQQEEDAEAKKWEEGSKNSKGNKQEKAEKAAALKAAKAERDRLLEEETKSIKVAKPKEDTKTSNKQSGSSKPIASKVPEYSARNIALDLLELISDDEGNAEKIGAKAAKTVDAHPERRFKAAFETYKEQELPSVRKEHPGLRLQQYHELLFKKFQKHPNNPYNQVTVSYDATKGDKVEALKAKKKQVEDRLKAE